MFYKTFDEVKDRRFDGMILTGAPLDFVDFEDVDYWDEIVRILDWSHGVVASLRTGLRQSEKTAVPGSGNAALPRYH